MARRAVILDRDGTVNTEEEFLSDPDHVHLEKNAAAGLLLLSKGGYELVVASNQSGVARGLFDESSVRAVNEKIRELLAAEGVSVAGFYYCPHHPEGEVAAYTRECDCRKPAPGLLLRAADELDLDLSASFAVGDRSRDIEAGRRAGAGTVLVRTGYGRTSEPEVLEMDLADCIADDLLDAARWILAHPREVEK